MSRPAAADLDQILERLLVKRRTRISERGLSVRIEAPLQKVLCTDETAEGVMTALLDAAIGASRTAGCIRVGWLPSSNVSRVFFIHHERDDGDTPGEAVASADTDSAVLPASLRSAEAALTREGGRLWIESDRDRGTTSFLVFSTERHTNGSSGGATSEA